MKLTASASRLLLLIALLLLVLWLETGCAAKQRAKFVAPPGCYKNPHFNKPCQQVDKIHVRCDDVIYAVYCVRPAK